MSTSVTIVAATEKEIEPLLIYLKHNGVTYTPTQFQLNDMIIDILITGIGILNTTYALVNYLMDHTPDIWIQAGIGGAFDPSLEIGNVYLIESEVLVDFGAEDKDGRMIGQFELGWTMRDQFPYTGEILVCPYITPEAGIPFASAMTTLYSHGFAENIEKLNERPHGQIENMEGAAFFYVSLMKKIPFLSLRAISNHVGPRDTSLWEIDRAIKNLNDKSINMLRRKIFPAG